MSTTPGSYNMVIYAGATFDITFTYKDSNGSPIDLTGYSAQMQIRRTVGASSTLLDISDSSGEIILGGAAGTVQILLDDAATSALSWEGRAVYALELTSPASVVTRLLEGSVRVSPEVVQ